MRGDGDGWVVSEVGTYHWGVHGAAGLLLRAPLHTGRPAVLLQHRAPWSHQGGTWALPGGAMDFGETPWEAALREAHEEAGLAEEHITYRATILTAEVSAVGGGTWTYSTVVADASEPLLTVANRESVELRWVPEDDVTDLPLHPAFEKSWQALRISDRVSGISDRVSGISDQVPAHDCAERPHTVVIDKVFHWCRAGTPFRPAQT